MAITGTGLDSQKGILADTAIWFHIIRVSHAVRKVGDGLCYLISSHYLVRFPILVGEPDYPLPSPHAVLGSTVDSSSSSTSREDGTGSLLKETPCLILSSPLEEPSVKPEMMERVSSALLLAPSFIMAISLREVRGPSFSLRKVA